MNIMRVRSKIEETTQREMRDQGRFDNDLKVEDYMRCKNISKLID